MDYFVDHFLNRFFGPFFFTIMGGEAHRYYLRRDGMQSISPEGGVGGRVFLTRQGRERERERGREREREREKLLLRREE